jgi:hypothetical protein
MFDVFDVFHEHLPGLDLVPADLPRNLFPRYSWTR